MPERLFTVSDCISDVHPHGNVLLRGQDPYESKFALPSEYERNVEELVSMRAWMDRPRGSWLGFDVLGAEGWGSYHTFACNALTRPCREHLGIVDNAYGLIDDYEQAVEACSYTLRDDMGAEPVAWYPFRVDEYPV